jgi:plasmid maintenance system killer protein
MRINSSPRFSRSFRKLSSKIQKKAVERMRIFRESEGRDKRLNVHKLHGKKKTEWSFSVDRSYRITFIFMGDGTALFLDIGTNDQLYK